VTATFVYLKRPPMSAAFAVTALTVAPGEGLLSGPDLKQVTKFLRMSEGVPRFDLECAGRQFRECHLRVDPSGESLLFSFDSMSSPGSAL